MAFKQKCGGCGLVKDMNGELHIQRFPISRKLRLCWDCALEAEDAIINKKKKNIRGLASELAKGIEKQALAEGKRIKESEAKQEQERNETVSKEA